MKRVAEVAYVFRAEVEADDDVQAVEALREALVEALTWDGDDEAPEVLETLEMRLIDAVSA